MRIVAIVLGLCCAPPALAQPAGERGLLVAIHSERCLGGAGGAPAAVDCDRDATVTLAPQPDGTFLIRNDRAGACLFSNADGRFGWYACTPAYGDQHWSWLADAAPPGQGRLLRAALSGRCLFSNADGRFGLYTCSETYGDQRWRLLRGERPWREPVATESPRRGDEWRRLAGQWQWRDGEVTVVKRDGTFLLPNDGVGTWQPLGDDVFELRWSDGRIERVRVSPDGTTLARSGARGEWRGPVLARRADRPAPATEPPPPPPPPRDCGTGPDDPACDERLAGALPMPADVFGGLVAAARATSSEITRRNLIIEAARPAVLTARQLTTLLELFRSDVTKLQVVRAVQGRVVDPQRALAYAASLRSSASREAFVRLMSAPPTPPPPAPPPVQPTPRQPPPAPEPPRRPRPTIDEPQPHAAAASGDAYACTSVDDCVIFCPSVPSCCGSSCGCTHAIRRDHTAEFAASYARTCSHPPQCPPVACERREAGFADCQNGRCVPAMIH